MRSDREHAEGEEEVSINSTDMTTLKNFALVTHL